MKTKNFLMVSGAFLALGTLASCVNTETIEMEENGRTLHFYVAGVETRTSTGDINNGRLHEGNSVGIFGISTPTVTNGSNNKYTVDSNGQLAAESGKDMKAQERSSLDIYAYAPHQTSWNTHTTANDFSVSTDQSDVSGYLASDLLHADKATITGVSATTNTVGLTFKHKMARLILNITKEDGADNLSGAKVTVNNTKTTVPFTLENGTLGAATGEITDITALTVLGDKTTVYAIVAPQELDSETTLFTIQTDDRKFSLKLNDAVTFASGNSYTYTVNVKKTELKDVTITLTSVPTVSDWTEVTGQGSTDAEESPIN